jgi:aldose 1-epimerase
MFAPTSENKCGDNCTRYDNSFIVDRPLSTSPESTALSVLTRSSPLTGIKMELYTNQQTLLIYTCNKLNGTIPSKRS